MESGTKIVDLTREYGISDETYCKLKAKYENMRESYFKGLKVLKYESRKLKQLVSEQAIYIKTLEKLIKDNEVYVDKTEHIYNLINNGSIYFLSRPRRFGKSLLISTIQQRDKTIEDFKTLS